MTSTPTRVVGRHLTKEEIAARIAADIPCGSYVNLGIGQPTLVSSIWRSHNR